LFDFAAAAATIQRASSASLCLRFVSFNISLMINFINLIIFQYRACENIFIISLSPLPADWGDEALERMHFYV
jgi:hypothetical protein